MSLSKRRLVWVLGMLAVLPLTGCEIDKPVPPPAAVDKTPIKIDDAMAARQWPVTEARYSNDHVIAGSTLFMLSTKTVDSPINAFGDTGIFLANIVLMPYEVFDAPAWKDIEYKSLVMNPTYTANPPLPTSPVAPVK
jgi:hypothetical protein